MISAAAGHQHETSAVQPQSMCQCVHGGVAAPQNAGPLEVPSGPLQQLYNFLPQGQDAGPLAAETEDVLTRLRGMQEQVRQLTMTIWVCSGDPASIVLPLPQCPWG
jgi:hypothetical protein